MPPLRFQTLNYYYKTKIIINLIKPIFIFKMTSLLQLYNELYIHHSESKQSTHFEAYYIVYSIPPIQLHLPSTPLIAQFKSSARTSSDPSHPKTHKNPSQHDSFPRSTRELTPSHLDAKLCENTATAHLSAVVVWPAIRGSPPGSPPSVINRSGTAASDNNVHYCAG